MNAREAGQLLSILSAVDRREVDATTAQGWAWALNTIPYDRALQAAKNAFDAGVRYVDVNAIKAELKTMQPRLEADVRSAKARGIIPKTWPKDQPLTAELEQELNRQRSDLYRATNDNPDEIGRGNDDGPDFGRIGKDVD